MIKFKEYVEKYRQTQNPLIILSNISNPKDPSTWVMRDKIGLIWFILNEKGGNFYDFEDLVTKIINPNLNNVVGKDIEDIYEMLPDKFIKSLKDNNQ